MENSKTIGEIVDKAIAKATAEMAAGRRELMTEYPRQGDLNAFIEARNHFAEAIEAILTAAGAFGGKESKLEVLEQALLQHDLEIK